MDLALASWSSASKRKYCGPEVRFGEIALDVSEAQFPIPTGLLIEGQKEDEHGASFALPFAEARQR